MIGPLIRGLDIAYVQRVASGGLVKRVSDSKTLADIRDFDFVIIKATQGTGIKDSQYANSYAMARKFGLKVMAYHFNDNRVSIPAQADFFLSVAKDADYLWLDQEGEFGFSDAQAQQFIDYVRSKGRKIGLYHSASGFGGVTADAQWVADYRESSRADGAPPVAGWDIWQFSSEGGPDGAGLDLDYMPNDSPLALELGLVYVAKTSTDAVIASLNRNILELNEAMGVMAAKHEQDLADQAAQAAAAKDAAVAAERETIALAMGRDMADKVRNAQ